jgi:hypothetical protein
MGPPTIVGGPGHSPSAALTSMRMKEWSDKHLDRRRLSPHYCTHAQISKHLMARERASGAQATALRRYWYPVFSPAAFGGPLRTLLSAFDNKSLDQFRGLKPIYSPLHFATMSALGSTRPPTALLHAHNILYHRLCVSRRLRHQLLALHLHDTKEAETGGQTSQRTDIDKKNRHYSLAEPDGRWQVASICWFAGPHSHAKSIPGIFSFSSKLITGLKVEARDGTWRGFTACCFTASALC